MRNRVVYYRVRPVLRVLSVAFPCLALGLVGSPAFAQVSGQGRWVAPPDGMGGFDYAWSQGTQDAALLSTGKVLVWESAETTPKLWNPTDGVFTNVPCSAPVCTLDLHCTGHALLTDGSLLATGGGHNPTTETRIFRLSANAWERGGDMFYGRFYPTTTALPDGKVLVVAGRGDSGPPWGGGTVLKPEIYDSSCDEWELVDIPTDGIAEQYPFMSVLPDGKVFYAGGSAAVSPPAVKTHTLDIQSTPAVWDEFPEDSDSFFGGKEGAAVMYEPGKILKAGGVDANGQPIDLVARIEIDTNGSTPG